VLNGIQTQSAAVQCLLGELAALRSRRGEPAAPVALRQGLRPGGGGFRRGGPPGRVLDRVLLSRLPADARASLRGREVELEISDFGLRVRLQLNDCGFTPAPDHGPAAVRIVAPLSSHWRLLRGEVDPDQLFFERALVIEGDTELGLVLKNSLDAIGPLWPPPAAARPARADRH
jgi:predicted lipid carrier protein YhbT